MESKDKVSLPLYQINKLTSEINRTGKIRRGRGESSKAVDVKNEKVLYIRSEILKRMDANITNSASNTIRSRKM